MKQTNPKIYFLPYTFQFFTDFDKACEEAYSSIREDNPHREISEPFVVRWNEDEYTLMAVSHYTTHKRTIQALDVDAQSKAEKQVYKAVLEMNKPLWDNDYLEDIEEDDDDEDIDLDDYDDED